MNVGPKAPDISLSKSLPSHNSPLLLPNHTPQVNLYPNHTPQVNLYPNHMRLSLLSPFSFLTDAFSRRILLLRTSLPLPAKNHHPFRPIRPVKSFSHSVEHLACDSQKSDSDEFKFEGDGDGRDLKRLDSPGVEVKELEELPEQWRRARLAWLCKELPAHKAGTVVRILNAQRKWMRQDDVTYLVVHCTRIRENEVAFKVYKWMMQQRWYQFDFALATKLADYLGKERKFARCREVYDDIVNQGRVPSESTFHILVVAYLGASVEGCLDEACAIYNRMIQLGGYNPRLSLHNALFRALVAKPRESKRYLKQAEFIYHNLVATGLEVQKDIYGGLIWLHSYQDVVDKERIMELREEMVRAGIEEGKDVVVSILRACSKDGDLEEAEKCWAKLVGFKVSIPSLAFVYRMETFAKVGEPMKSMETFRMMQEPTISAYQKIIEVMCKARRVELAESLMVELVRSGLKPLTPSYIELVTMYLSLSMHHDKVESAFESCVEKCQPNRALYNLYLDSLLRVGDLAKAEAIFKYMQSTESIGLNSATCNTILSGYLESGDHVKAEKVYDLMCKKRYSVESWSMNKLEHVLSSNRKNVMKPPSLKLSAEQREALVGLLLGGLKIESDDYRKNRHAILFELNENSTPHSVLRHHLYDEYHEWLHPSCRIANDLDETPYKFATIPHSYFGFYADQFWPGGRPAIPKLIHRWLSPRALAYWYMYGGCRVMQTGDIVLKLKGDDEGVLRVVKALRGKSLECRVKRKGRVFWIGFVGESSDWFWKLVEPHVLDGLQECLRAGGSNRGSGDGGDVSFDSESGDEEVGIGDGSDRGRG